MTQTADLIHKMAEFIKSEEFFEKGEDARLELSPDDVRCMNEVIKACGNAISKQQAKTYLYDRINRLKDDELYDIFSVIIDDMVNDLSSVKPQTGHWIMRHRKVNTINYRTGEDVLTGEIHTVKELIRYECDEPYCSECGKRAGDTSGNYCCFCGARMESEQNG